MLGRDHLVGVGYLLRWTYLVRQQRALGSDWRQFPSTMRILSSTRAWMFSARLSRRLQARCRNTYRGKQLTLGGGGGAGAGDAPTRAFML